MSSARYCGWGQDCHFGSWSPLTCCWTKSDATENGLLEPPPFSMTFPNKPDKAVCEAEVEHGNISHYSRHLMHGTSTGCSNLVQTKNPRNWWVTNPPVVCTPLNQKHCWKKNITKKVKKHSPALKKDSRQAPQLPNDATTFTIYK